MKKMKWFLMICFALGVSSSLFARISDRFTSYPDDSWLVSDYQESQQTFLRRDITSEIPEIVPPSEIDGYAKVPNVAQYKQADWENVVGIARGITLRQAKKIADDNPEITFFFRMKGDQMVLEREDGTYRAFQHGDTVFFTGEPCWGSAEGFSDGYMKQ